jgi:type IV pilus assembly protein PilY1
MEMSALTGSRLDTAPFDLNNDGLFTSADNIPVLDGSGNVIGYTPISGVASESGMGILQTPGVIDAERGEGRPVQYKYSPGSSGGIQRVIENPGAGATGRQSWRQIR